MPRSEESKAKRREYTRKWRESQRGKDYHAQWRIDHRESNQERKREWRRYNRDLIRAQRQRYYQKHPRLRATVEELPVKFQGHDFFDTARFICGNQPYLDVGLVWEEVMAEVVLALVEGRDPNEAAVATWRRERGWSIVGPLYPNTDIREHDRKVVFKSARDD